MYLKSFSFLLLTFISSYTFGMCNPAAGLCALFTLPYHWLTNSNMPQAEKLFNAALTGNQEEFKQLIDNGATFKYIDPKTGKNALHIIAEKNLTGCLAHVIEHKKLFSKKQNAPSLFTNERGYANAEIKDKERKTPLHYAAEHGNVEIAQMLIDYQVNIHQPDQKGNIPLFYALKNKRPLFVDLLKKSTDQSINWPFLCLEYKNKNGNMAIHFASQGNAIDFIEKILAKNINLLNITNTLEQTPLHIAIKHENFDLAQRLMSHKTVDLCARDINGNTPLHYAVEQQNTDLIDSIIRKNRDIEKIANNDNKTPFALAHENDWKVGEEHFMQNHAKDSTYVLDQLLSKKIDYDMIENVLKKGASTTVTTTEGKTPLAVAAQKLDLRAVQLIMKYAPETVNRQDNKNNLPLHLALQSLIDQKETSDKDKEVIQALLIEQATLVDKNDKPLRNADGNSVLDLAIKLPIDITNAILKQNPKNTLLINDLHPSDGFSPFLNACYFGKLDYVKLFISGDKAELEKSVSNKLSRYDGDTPLLIAAERGHKEIYEYLKKVGCNQKASGKDGWNLAILLLKNSDKLDKDGKELETFLNSHPEYMLHKTTAHTNLLYFAIQYNNEKLFTYLSAQYPQFIHEQNNHGHSPMHKAIESKNHHAIEIMKSYAGIPNNILNADKSNYLFCALQTGDKDIISLCAVPTLINTVDQKTGLTALSWAIKEKKIDIAKILLSKNADPKVENENGTTTLDLAVGDENKEAFDLLFSLYTSDKIKQTLYIAIDKKDYYFNTLLRKMSKKDIDLFFNSSFKDKDCFLHYAIDNKLLSKIDIALANGLNPNQPFSDGALPLHYAILHGNKKIVEMITNQAHSIHALDKYGRNALMLAALKGDSDLVAYFLSHKLNPHVTAQNGQTVLHFAAQSGNTDTLNKVLKLGIAIDTQDNNGNSPLLIAAQHGNTQGVQILAQHKANIELVNNAGNDVITLLKEQENKASYFNKSSFETVRINLEKQKLDLINERVALGDLHGKILALQQQNLQLLSQLQNNASHFNYVYQPAKLSILLQNLNTLSKDQLHEEAKKLAEQKKVEEKAHQQLVVFWQQLYPYSQQPTYQNQVSFPEPSAPPMDPESMTPEKTAEYAAELNKVFGNNQQQWTQTPQQNNQSSYEAYQNTYPTTGNTY